MPELFHLFSTVGIRQPSDREVGADHWPATVRLRQARSVTKHTQRTAAKSSINLSRDFFAFLVCMGVQYERVLLRVHNVDVYRNHSS